MVLRENYDQRIGIIGSKNVGHKLNVSFVQILDDCQQLYIKYSTKAGRRLTFHLLVLSSTFIFFEALY